MLNLLNLTLMKKKLFEIEMDFVLNVELMKLVNYYFLLKLMILQLISLDMKTKKLLKRKFYEMFLLKEINISELVIYYQEMKMVIFTLLIELVIHLDGKEKIAPLLK